MQWCKQHATNKNNTCENSPPPLVRRPSPGHVCVSIRASVNSFQTTLTPNPENIYNYSYVTKQYETCFWIQVPAPGVWQPFNLCVRVCEFRTRAHGCGAQARANTFFSLLRLYIYIYIYLYIYIYTYIMYTYIYIYIHNIAQLRAVARELHRRDEA